MEENKSFFMVVITNNPVDYRVAVVELLQIYSKKGFEIIRSLKKSGFFLSQQLNLNRARICKCLRSREIDSKESIPSAYVARRAGTSNRVVVPALQAGNRFLGLLKRFTNSCSCNHNCRYMLYRKVRILIGKNIIVLWRQS